MMTPPQHRTFPLWGSLVSVHNCWNKNFSNYKTWAHAALGVSKMLVWIVETEVNLIANLSYNIGMVVETNLILFPRDSKLSYAFFLWARKNWRIFSEVIPVGVYNFQHYLNILNEKVHRYLRKKYNTYLVDFHKNNLCLIIILRSTMSHSLERGQVCMKRYHTIRKMFEREEWGE